MTVFSHQPFFIISTLLFWVSADLRIFPENVSSYLLKSDDFLFSHRPSFRISALYTPYSLHSISPFVHITFYSRNNTFFVIHHCTAFHHCTFSFITAHF